MTQKLSVTVGDSFFPLCSLSIEVIFVPKRYIVPRGSLFNIENSSHSVLPSRPFYDKRISAEVEGDSLGDEWKGYVFRITGGNDKQGFCLTQGVLTNKRVRLLLSKG